MGIIWINLGCFDFVKANMKAQSTPDGNPPADNVHKGLGVLRYLSCAMKHLDIASTLIPSTEYLVINE